MDPNNSVIKRLWCVIFVSERGEGLNLSQLSVC